MKRGIKHQLKKKTLLFIAIFSIAFFVLGPEKVFAWEVHDWLIWDSVVWRYKQGHLVLEFISDVTTDELEVYFFEALPVGIGDLHTWIEKDISVVEGFPYSQPIIYMRCATGDPVENAEGVTPVQVLSLPCFSEPLNEENYIRRLKVYVEEDYEYYSWYPVGDLHFTPLPQPPTLTAIFPQTGTTTEIALGSFSATGDWVTGSLDWTFLEIQFSTSTTSTIYSFNIDILGETSGSYNIPVDLWYAGTYDVNYIFYGYGGLWGVMVLYYEVPIATTTLIVTEGIKQDWYDIIQPDFFEEEEPEEGTIQHYLWSIKKFLRGLFVATRDMKIKFLNTIFKIKTLFPYNYINAINNFFSDVEASIEQDPTLEISFFGAEVETIPLSFFDANITIGSETKPLFGWIKTIMNFALWGGFLLYIINFIRRLF